MNIKYRPEIDGLRALAVFPVIAFHAKKAYFPQGFLGVDIFFVISGFLITAIILGDLEKGCFAFANFYERRVRRIVPALFFVIFCSISIACLTISSAEELDTFVDSIVAALLFVANFFYWHVLGDYFSPSADYQPFLHIWSLAVEEQFYLFFPFILILLVKCSRRHRILWLSGLSLASLSANIIVEFYDPKLAFYMLPTRFWQLAIGALVAVAALDSINWRRSTLNVLSLFGGGAIVFAYSFSASASILTSSVPIVLGTALILAFARQGTVLAQILSSKPLLGIGLISYSLYLWHQPIFVFARLHFTIEALHSWHYLALSCLTAALAIFSWFFVEQPFRKKIKCTNRRHLFTTAGLAAVFLIVTGFSSAFVIKLHHVDNPFFTDAALVRAHNAGLSESCEHDFSQECIFGTSPEAILFGDSYALHLANALKESASMVSFIQFAASSCSPVFDYIIDIDQRTLDRCSKFANRIRAQIENHDSVKYVVLSARFEPLAQDRYNFWSAEKKQAGSVEVAIHKLREMLIYLISQGKKPVVISSTPRDDTDTTRCLEQIFQSKGDLSTCDMSLQNVLNNEDNKLATYLVQQLEDLAPVIYLHDFLCDEKICKSTINNYPLYRDAGHFSIKGSAYLGQEIDLYGIAKKRADGFHYRQLIDAVE